MRIDDSTIPLEIVWQGELQTPAEVYRGEGLPKVSIGKPSWWSDQKVLGEKWTPPAGGRRYGLARFVFTLRPAERQEISRAEFTVYLFAASAGPRPTAFDLYPKAVTEEQTGTRTVGLDPSLKFAEVVELSGVKAETTLNVKQSAPVITAYGIGESTARWVFESRPAHPLLGSQSAYAVVELPPGVEAARASLQLSAEVATRYGPVRGLIKETEQARLSFVLA